MKELERSDWQSRIPPPPPPPPHPHAQRSRVHGSWRAFMGHWITGRLCHKCSFFLVCLFFCASPAGVLARPGQQLLRAAATYRCSERRTSKQRTDAILEGNKDGERTQQCKVVEGGGGGTAQLLTPCAACRCDTASGPLDLLWAERFNQVEGGWQQLFSGKTHQGRTYVIHINSSRLVATPLPSPPPPDSHLMRWSCASNSSPGNLTLRGHAEGQQVPAKYAACVTVTTGDADTLRRRSGIVLDQTSGLITPSTWTLCDRHPPTPPSTSRYILTVT